MQPQSGVRCVSMKQTHTLQTLILQLSTVGRLGHNVIHLIVLECTCRFINPICHCRECARNSDHWLETVLYLSAYHTAEDSCKFIEQLSILWLHRSKVLQ